MGRSQVVQRFRQSWLESPYPMVVEHARGDHRICAAPSLWMGARAFAIGLKEAGLGPGHVLAVPLSPGIAFVQWWVACLRSGVTFAPAAERAHARVADDGTLTFLRLPGEPAEAGAAVLAEDGSLAHADLDSFAAEAPRVAPGTIVFSAGTWRSVASMVEEMLGPLRDGAEIHVGVSPTEPLSLPDCRPEVLVGPASALEAWSSAGAAARRWIVGEGAR